MVIKVTANKDRDTKIIVSKGRHDDVIMSFIRDFSIFILAH